MKRIWVVGLLVSLVVMGCSSPAATSGSQNSAPAQSGGGTVSPTAAPKLEPVTPTPEPTTAVPEPTAAPPTATPMPEPVLPPGVIAGVVQDAEGPVGGATVRVRLTEYETATADDGSFTLTDLKMTEPISVTAWAAGYYVGGATAIAGLVPVTIMLKPHYTTDNLDYDWFEFGGIEGSASCAPCHHSYEEWQADAHSQSPLFDHV